MRPGQGRRRAAASCGSKCGPPLLLALERADAADCYQLLRLLVPGGKAESEDGSVSSSSGSKGNAAELLELAAAGVRQLLQRTGPATTAVRPDCVVCLDAPRSVALLPCGHLALCGACAARKEVARQCPVCRKRAHKALTARRSWAAHRLAHCCIFQICCIFPAAAFLVLLLV